MNPTPQTAELVLIRYYNWTVKKRTTNLYFVLYCIVFQRRKKKIFKIFWRKKIHFQFSIISFNSIKWKFEVRVRAPIQRAEITQFLCCCRQTTALRFGLLKFGTYITVSRALPWLSVDPWEKQAWRGKRVFFRDAQLADCSRSAGPSQSCYYTSNWWSLKFNLIMIS